MVSVDDLIGEILHDLLDVAIHYSESDVAMKARALENRRYVERVINGSHFFDLCTEIRLMVPERVLSGYSLRKRNSRPEILHLKCVSQKASGYCGHYAFYFALCGLELCRSTSRDNLGAYLQQLDHAGSFWRRYWLSVDKLLRNVRSLGDGSWWPWTKDGVMHGDMERSYMYYLLAEDYHSQHLGGQRVIGVLQYAYGQLMGSVVNICELQCRIDEFRGSLEPIHLALILGITNHWLTVLAYNIPSNGRVGIVYLDSNNVPILRASDEEIELIVKHKEQERIKKSGKGYSPWKRAVVLQAFKDQRELLDLLVECFCGDQNLRTALLDRTWNTLIDSYYAKVCNHRTTWHSMDCLLCLLKWLQEDHHPKGIRDSQVIVLGQVGVEWLSAVTKDRIILWMDNARSVCCMCTDIEESRELLDVLDELQNLSLCASKPTTRDKCAQTSKKAESC